MPDTAMSNRFDADASLYWSVKYDQHLYSKFSRLCCYTPDFVD